VACREAHTHVLDQLPLVGIMQVIVVKRFVMLSTAGA
jgi:hypothetical protein